MIQLIVNNEYVDLYGDETVEMNVALKDFRTQGKNLASFTNTFTVPASDTNNKIFQFYFEQNRVVSPDLDFRTRVAARIEINYSPFREGYIVMDEGNYKMGRINN